MKTLLTILTAIFLISCGTTPEEEQKSIPPAKTDPPIVIIIDDPTTDTDPPTGDPTGDIEPLPETGEVRFAVKIDESLYFYRGKNLNLWKTGKINKAGPQSFSVGNILYTLDASGNEIEIVELDSTPDAIKITDSGTYHCTEYPPALALSLGGLYRTYSEFYKDNSIISAWMNNQFTCESITSVGTEIFSTDSIGNIRTIDGISTTVFYVLDDVFYNHSLYMEAKQFNFNDSVVVYGLNSAPAADQWINFDGLNYSGNGYTWNVENSLIYAANPLDEFNTPYYFGEWRPAHEKPVLLAVGEYMGKLYWIECGRGELLEYDPVENTLVKKWTLYAGDDLKNTGQQKRDILKPLIYEGILYFTNDDSISWINIETGQVGIFYGGLGEVVGF